MIAFVERVLILAKTYPSPSARYVETSCVAGINDSGKLLRLYPVPFRLLEEGQQFRKWQWVTANVRKSTDDHRPESHRIYIDTIKCDETPLSTKNHWEARWLWIDKIPLFTNFAAIEGKRQESKESLALLRPKRILGLEIKPSRHADWTDEERAKLIQEQMQGSLFAQTEAEQQIKDLRKIPFDFYYSYVCDTPSGETEYRHKIVDWEAGALYWHCHRNHGPGWEPPFRAKLEEKLLGQDLMFLMGNIHRFQDQWLIVSLIHPPKQRPIPNPQTSLF